MADLDSKRRFGNRVCAYRSARPGYPDELVDRLLAEVPTEEPEVAELGSGTGIFTGALLERGCHVYAVEPNAEMRTAGEAVFAGNPNFSSVAASAEETGLEVASVDLIVSAQAFHWFDFDRTRAEAERILRSPGVVAWVWNSRRTTGAAFAEAFERLLEEWGNDYEEVRSTYRVRERLADFFPESRLERAVFDNSQQLDLLSLRTRVLSASYMPASGHPRHQGMLDSLERLFESHNTAGSVRLDFDSELFWTSRPSR